MAFLFFGFLALLVLVHGLQDQSGVHLPLSPSLFQINKLLIYFMGNGFKILCRIHKH